MGISPLSSENDFTQINEQNVTNSDQLFVDSTNTIVDSNPGARRSCDYSKGAHVVSNQTHSHGVYSFLISVAKKGYPLLIYIRSIMFLFLSIPSAKVHTNYVQSDQDSTVVLTVSTARFQNYI